MKKELNYEIIKFDIELIKNYLNKTVSQNWSDEFPRLGLSGLPKLNEIEMKEIDSALRDLIVIRNKKESIFQNNDIDLRILNLFINLSKSSEPLYTLNVWIKKEKIPQNFIDDFFGILESGLYYFFLEYDINVYIEIFQKEKIEIYREELQSWPLIIKNEFKEIEELYEEEKWDKLGLNIHQLYDKLAKKIFEVNNIKQYNPKQIVNILFPWSGENITSEWLNNLYKVIPDIRHVFKNWNKPDPEDGKLTKSLYKEIKNNPQLYARIYIDISKMVFNTILLSEKVKSKN